jgi:hypothetical protein
MFKALTQMTGADLSAPVIDFWRGFYTTIQSIIPSLMNVLKCGCWRDFVFQIV